MIDLKGLVDIQRKGLAQIDSLSPDELQNLKVLMSLCTEAITGISFDKGATYEDAVLNAFQYGLACGLTMKVKDGKLGKR